MQYYQCVLSQNSWKTVAWIPENGAVQGKRVELKDVSEVNKFWNVDQVYSPGMDEQQFKERQLLQRKWHNNI